MRTARAIERRGSSVTFGDKAAMRMTSVRFIEGVASGVPAVALVTFDTCFWRREEAVASRMSLKHGVARQNRFEMIEGSPVEREEWANIEPRAQCGVAGCVFDGRDSVRPVCEAAFPFGTPNQSLEPTPPAGTSAAGQPLVPAAVVAHL